MSKQGNITLNLDFNVEKAKLQEVGAILGKDLEKGVKGSKSLEYIDNAKKSLNTFTKQVHGLYNDLSKPLVSKGQAKDLVNAISGAFDQIDNKLLSIQGNIGKTFNSTANTQAIKKIKALGNELDQLKADYQEISQLTSKSRGLGNKNDLKSQINNATKELEVLKSKQEKLTTEELKTQKELNRLIREGNKALEEKAVISDQITAIQEKNGYSTQSSLETAISTKTTERNDLISGAIVPEDVETVNQALTELRHILASIQATSNATLPKVNADFDAIAQAEKDAEMQAKTFKSILQELGIPMLSLQEIVSMMKQVISYSYDYLKKLDAALTEIAVVSDKTRSEVMGLTDTFIELSQKTGMAIDDIAQASTIFYQQGLGDEAVKKLSEYTAIFAKISGEDVPTAADQLTAAINGFGFAADDVASVVDKMSVLAAYSAADIDELATAMSKGASQAAMAGLTFDEYNAYLATMIETTREAPENLGTSLKTIMSRFQSIKKGENTEDDTDVNQVETALKSVGVQLRDSEGQLRELGDVLNELGPKWATLDRNTQAYLGTVIAGTRQQSRFISLMQNWDRALELTAASENSAGAAARMHAKAMEGLEASLNTLTNAWQKLISNLANGDSFKWIIDGLASVIGWFGEGNTALKIFTSAMVLWNAKTLITNMNLAAQGKEYKNLDSAINTVVGRVKTLTGNITNLMNPMSKETLEIEKQTAKIREQINAYRDLDAAKQGSPQIPNAATSDGDIIPDVKPTGGSGTVGAKNIKINNAKASSGSFVLSKKSPVGEVQGLNTAVQGLGKTSVGVGAKIKTLGSNVVGALGSVQTSLMVATLAVTALEFAADLLITTADEMKEEAQEAYNEKQEEIDKNLTLIQTVESNLQVYEELSRKINKSSEEVNQLAEAADALAEAAPGALIGYDENGNAIIDVGAAKAEAKNAEAELVEDAKDQIANVGNLAKAELREQAEKNVAANSNGGYDTAQAVGTGGVIAGITTFGVTMMAVPEPTMVTKIIGGISLAVAGLGAVLFGTSTAAEEAAINQEQYNLAVEKAAKMSKENLALILQNMSYITNAQIRDNTVDGVSVGDRTNMANYIGNEWIQAQTDKLFEQLASGEIDEAEYEEKYQNLGKKWEKLLQEIDDRALATAYTHISEVAEDIGDKTYGEVESSIEGLIKNDLGIKESDPLFETLKTAFMKAAYSGTGTGIYGVLDELETAKKKDMKKALDFRDLGGSQERMRAVDEKYAKAEKNVKNMSGNELDFYSNAGITNNVDLFNSMIDQYGPTIKAALVDSTEAATVQSIAILSQYRDAAITELNNLAADVGAESYEEINYDELTKEQQATYDYWIAMSLDASSSIENAWNSLEISIDIPWEQLWDDFEELTDRVRTTRETLASLTSDEGIDPDQWKEFTTILDDIDFSAMDADQISQYADALDTVAANLKVVDGQIYANGEALESIADLEEAAIQASIQKTKVELMNKQIELEASKSIIDAQIATLEYQIAAAQGAANAEDLKIKAQNAWVESSNKMNTFYLQNQGTVTETLVAQYSNAFTAIATKYNQLQTAMADGSIGADEIGALQNEWKSLQEDLTFDSYSAEISGLDLSTLESELAAAKKVSSQYEAQIANIGLKLATLDSGLFYSKNGVGGGDSAEIEQYIGELEEIYNLLRKIEGAENRLNNLEDYSSLSRGKDHAKYLQERIKLTQDLTGEYKDLLAAQKYIENTEQQAILNSPVGDVFSFDEFGNIIIDYEKYVKLQDESIDGKQSEKELADALYKEYQEIHETTQEYYDNLIANIEKALDAQQELVDTYVEQENDLADAVKDIYQDMLDNKLEAIDKEIEALDKLKEARDDANKSKENSKELSKLQTSLKRSMMDTSGASNTKVLDYQDQIQAKLEEMGEDEYTKRMDAIKESLEEQKEQLQRNFDEFFENYEALYDLIENRILTSEEAVIETLKTTEEYLHASDAERAQLIDEWTTRYQTAMTATTDGGTIMDVVNSIFDLKDSIPDIDSTLQNHDFAEDVGTGVSRALTEYFGSKDTDKGGGGSGGGGGSVSSGAPKTEPVAVQGTGSTPKPDTSGMGSGEVGDVQETISWWERLKGAVVGFFTSIPGWWNQYVAPWFTVEKWDELMNGIATAIHNFVTGIPDTIVNLATGIGSGISSLWEGIKSFLSDAWNKLWGMVPDSVKEKITTAWNSFYETIEPLVNSIKDLFSSVWDAIKVAWDTLEPYIMGVWERIKSVFAVVGDVLGGAFSVAWETIKTGFSIVYEKFKLVWETIKTLFKGAIDVLVAAFNMLWSRVKAIWNNIVDVITTVISIITAIIDTAVGLFTGDFDKIGEAWGKVWTNIKDLFSGIWETIKTWFTSGITFFTDVGKAIWNAITGVFKNIGNFFKNVWEDIKNGFSNIGTKVADTFSSAIKAGLNGLMSTFEGIVNTFINLINGALNVINAIPGVDIKKLNKVEFKRFKKGGMADFTGPAWLDGTKSAPEAVLNASQTKAFLKLADNLDKFEGGFGNSIVIENISFNVDSMSSVEDGEKAFDAFVNRFKEIGSQTGLSFNTTRL